MPKKNITYNQKLTINVDCHRFVDEFITVLEEELMTSFENALRENKLNVDVTSCDVDYDGYAALELDISGNATLTYAAVNNPYDGDVEFDVESISGANITKNINKEFFQRVLDKMKNRIRQSQVTVKSDNLEIGNNDNTYLDFED